MIDILAIGNAKIDVFVMLNNLSNFSYDKFSNQISFPLGSKIPFGDHPLTLGGNACNVSVAMSKLGLQSSLSAIIGKDEFSKKVLAGLKTANVNTDNIRIENTTNPSFNIALSFEGERTILEEENEFKSELSIPRLNPKIIYLTSIAGDWQSVFNEAFSNNPNSEFALNPGSKMLNENLEEVIKILPKIKILFVNLQEAQKIARNEETDIKILIKKIKTWGPSIVVITDGINGSFSIDESDQIYQIGTMSDDQPLEKTGAGDGYASGFMYAILKGHMVKDAMRYGSISADAIIRKIGAQEGQLTSGQIEELSRNNLNFQAQRL